MGALGSLLIATMVRDPSCPPGAGSHRRCRPPCTSSGRRSVRSCPPALHGQPAGIADRPRRRQFRAQHFGQFLDQRNVLRFLDAAAHRHDDVRPRSDPPRAPIRGSSSSGLVRISDAAIVRRELLHRRRALPRPDRRGRLRPAAKRSAEPSPANRTSPFTLPWKNWRTSTTVARLRRDAPTTSLTSTVPSDVASLGRKSRTW